MPNRRIALAAISCAAIGFIASSGAALAQSDYPTKPVKIIVPFPAGGTSDVMGRLVAEELGKILKQPFIVENIGGAGGVIGTERGAKAAPDGYTLIQTGVGQSAVAHGLDPNLKYNSITDFVHISQVNSGPNVLVVMSSGGPETRHLVSADVLRELGSQGYLINVSRGSVVDEEALVQALEDGVIAGAVWTCMPMNRAFPSGCWRWSRSCCCPTWPAPRMKRGRRWPTWCWKISIATSRQAQCAPPQPDDWDKYINAEFDYNGCHLALWSKEWRPQFLIALRFPPSRCSAARCCWQASPVPRATGFPWQGKVCRRRRSIPWFA